MPNPGDVITIAGCPCCGSSSSSSSSSSGGCSNCQCCLGFYFDGASSSCDSHYATYSKQKSWMISGSGLLSCSSVGFGGVYDPANTGGGSITGQLTIGSPSVIVMTMSLCTSHKATYRKSDGINGCLYGDYTLTSQTDVGDSWPSALTVVNTITEFGPASVPSTITITFGSTCLFTGVTNPWVLSLFTGIATCPYGGYGYYATWRGTIVAFGGANLTIQMSFGCGYGTIFGVSDGCSSGGFGKFNQTLSSTKIPNQFPSSGDTGYMYPGTSGISCQSYLKTSVCGNPVPFTITY